MSKKFKLSSSIQAHLLQLDVNAEAIAKETSKRIKSIRKTFRDAGKLKLTDAIESPASAPGTELGFKPSQGHSLFQTGFLSKVAVRTSRLTEMSELLAGLAEEIQVLIKNLDEEAAAFTLAEETRKFKKCQALIQRLNATTAASNLKTELSLPPARNSRKHASPDQPHS